MNNNIKTQVVVIGAGPGGYAAAFRASDLGFKTTLIEKNDELGGVCLNVGCIPSKALLHISKSMEESLHLKKMGITFQEPEIDIYKVKKWKNEVVKKLNNGISSLAKARKIDVIHGYATFLSNNKLEIKSKNKSINLEFENCIIATGSSPRKINTFPNDKRIMDSTSALELNDIPNKISIIGGGYIGLEMGSIYHSLGSEVTIIEYLPNLLPGADPDLVRPLEKILRKKFKKIILSTKVDQIKTNKNDLQLLLSSNGNNYTIQADKVLVSIGRTPNTKNLNLENTNVKLNDKGFILTDKTMKTGKKSFKKSSKKSFKKSSKKTKN